MPAQRPDRMGTRAGPGDSPRLTRFAWLAIGTAITTMALKTAAWVLTGSVGFLSDAAESVVNLVAAVVALVALRVSAKPADVGHQFGHGKAEYLSAAVEGIMIFVAAVAIIITAVERLINPIVLVNVETGLVVSGLAGAINGVVGFTLLRAGQRHRSLTLTAGGKHLLTDVATSVGVIVGVVAVAWTGYQRLDPIVALLIGINIIITGVRLLARAIDGLMDHALRPTAQAKLAIVLAGFAADRDVTFHAVRTRESGRFQLVTLHVVVPGEWTVRQGHDLLTEIESAIGAVLQDCYVQGHLEPQGEACPHESRPAPPHQPDARF